MCMCACVCAHLGRASAISFFFSFSCATSSRVGLFTHTNYDLHMKNYYLHMETIMYLGILVGCTRVRLFRARRGPRFLHMKIILYIRKLLFTCGNYYWLAVDRASCRWCGSMSMSHTNYDLRWKLLLFTLLLCVCVCVCVWVCVYGCVYTCVNNYTCVDDSNFHEAPAGGAIACPCPAASAAPVCVCVCVFVYII